MQRCSTATPALPTAASTNRQPAGAASRQRMLSPVGSSVTMPVGFAASTMRSVEESVTSPAKRTLRVQARTPVPAFSATASSHRSSVANTATARPSVAVSPHIRALLRV